MPKELPDEPGQEMKDFVDKLEKDIKDNKDLLKEGADEKHEKDQKDGPYPDPLAQPQVHQHPAVKILKDLIVDSPTKYPAEENDAGPSGRLRQKFLKDAVGENPVKYPKEESDGFSPGSVNPKILKDVIVDGPGRYVDSSIAVMGEQRAFIRNRERPSVGDHLVRRGTPARHPLIVILARSEDKAAQNLADRLGNGRAVLMTAADLSVAGWISNPLEPVRSRVVASGRELEQSQIGGVLVRIASITERDVLHIDPADRAYVASEMTAFLHSWLLGLSCPVLNRPHPTGLGGPTWRTERWLLEAQRLEIHTQPLKRMVNYEAIVKGEPGSPASCTITVVGSRSIGAGDEELSAEAKKLARGVGVEMLSARFSGGKKTSPLVYATSSPDISSDFVKEAIVEYFEDRIGATT